MSQQAAIPPDSLIWPSAQQASFSHCQSITLVDHGLPAMAHYLQMMRGMPRWIDNLMVLRNRLVQMVGLKDLGRLSAVNSQRSAGSYEAGQRVGIFTLLANTDDEVLLVDSDRHLDVHVALLRRPSAQTGQCEVVVSTVVRTHNLLGRLYMLPVAPFHRLIAPIALRRLRKG